MNLIKKLIEQRKGTYAATEYEASRSILEAWVDIWKIPNPIDPKHYHSTIIYSRTQISVAGQRLVDEASEVGSEWRFLPKSLALFKSSAVSKLDDVLVMLLEAPELVSLHRELCKHGASHEFDSYEPHITLSYNIPVDFEWQKIILPPVYFIPSRIYFEPLDVNWKE